MRRMNRMNLSILQILYAGLHVGGGGPRAVLLLLMLLGGILTGAHPLAAQSEPILVTLSALPPYASDLTAWESNPDKVLIRLQNRTGESYQVRLSGFAESIGGDTRIVTKNNYPRNLITVGPNAVVNLNLRDLQIFTADAVDVFGAEKTTIARTKQLPEGSYRMCVRALEFSTLEPLSPAEPSGCATFLIRLSEPPRPLMPACGTTVVATKPQRVIFQWSVPAGAPAGTQYDFEMTEVPQGRDPNDALASKTSPVFFTRRLSGSLLSYGPAEPPLVPGRTYAWRVRASDPTGGTSFRNDGYGEVCSFTWNALTPLIGEEDGVKIITPNLGGNDLDERLPEGLIGSGTGIRVRDLRLPEDLLAPACITLKPVLLRGGVDTKALPQFGLEIAPAINPGAIEGGMIEIYETESSLQSRFFNEKKTRPVYRHSFSGNGSDVFRHTRLGNLSFLELTFLNGTGSRETFRPEPKKSYRWRVTLEFDGEEIRYDGQVCNLDQARSPFGKFPDLIAEPDRPDTLVAAGFNIVVEKWDASSVSDDPNRPSGIGRIEFDCEAPPPATPVPWWRGDLTLVERDFSVVDIIGDSTAEFSLPEARTIRESSSVGDVLTVYMPDRTSEESSGGLRDLGRKDIELRSELLADRAVLLDLFGGKGLKGIRVAFRDVTWSGPVKPKVILTDGIAVYPSPIPLPIPPATLDLENGFRLKVDSLTIEAAEARVEGSLELPPSVISTDTCTMATLPVPETKITPWCEFYIESEETFGRWAIGETGLEVEGEGYVLDFSSTNSPSGPSPSLGNGWKGVLLRSGRSVSDPSGDVISNRGYTRAPYSFADGKILGDGFHDRLELSAVWDFTALDPYGYDIELKAGYLDVVASDIDTGEFKQGRIELPRNAITFNSYGDRIAIEYELLRVQSDMDLAGLVRVSGPLLWGERSRELSRPTYYSLSESVDSGAFWLGSHWQPKSFVPVLDTLYKTPTLAMPTMLLQGGWLESQMMGGATFTGMRERDFTIRTKDLPDQNDVLKFPASIVAGVWMHVGYNGVNSEILLRPNKSEPGPVDIGPVWSTGYLADSVPFHVIFADLGGASLPPVTTHQPDYDLKTMRFRFVQSAVWSSNLSGVVELGGSIGMPVAFRDMMFTSSANNAGGDVYFGGEDTLDYWGLEMVAKDSAASAGVLAVKQGVIYLTAAGMAERQHFDEPFWLTWGEMEASGDFGRLFFDYNNVGQRFDDFGYATEFVALSPWVAGDSGYIQTYGSLSIPFFGAKMMSISDYRSTAPDTPYFGRFVRILPGEHLGAGKSDLEWGRNWAGGLADMEFEMLYDTVAQYGFLGPGVVEILSIVGEMDAFLRMSARDACFRMIESDQRGFDIGPIASMGRISEIWGCGCIEEGTIKQIAVGGQLSHSATSTILQARAADQVSLVFGFTPDRTTFYANGQMFINIAGSDVDVFGLTHFIVDRAAMYAEGYFKGTVALGAVVGIPIVAGANAGISGFGEMDWHAGVDYQSIQGRVGVAMYGMVGGLGITVGGGTSLETGIFLGINAPKNRAWVMDGINGRFGLNKGGLPANLTGFYAYLGIKQGIDLFIVSGGYEVYVGVGAFAPSLSDPITGGIIGNVGIYIWGKILGGLVSAAAWGNLQMIAAIPPAFEGSLGLEACVLWLFCGSVSVHAGFNKEDGFYVY